MISNLRSFSTIRFVTVSFLIINGIAILSILYLTRLVSQDTFVSYYDNHFHHHQQQLQQQHHHHNHDKAQVAEMMSIQPDFTFKKSEYMATTKRIKGVSNDMAIHNTSSSHRHADANSKGDKTTTSNSNIKFSNNSTSTVLTDRAMKTGRIQTLKRLSDVSDIEITHLLDGQTSLNDFPPWSRIQHLYGASSPFIIGMETCEQYQKNVPSRFDRWISPAGLFHTGTNWLAGLLAETCLGVLPRWQVPWGKHNPVDAKEKYVIPKTVYNSTDVSNVLPIVMVRHPLDWMKSMCHRSYAASWNRTNGICPTLLLNANRNETGNDEQQTNSVSVGLYEKRIYKHLLDFWIRWNADYMELASSSFPRLIVRLEDLVYHPEATMQKVCTCAGGIFKKEAVTGSLLHQRQGGVTRRSQSSHLVSAWQRHGNISIQQLLPDINDQQYIHVMDEYERFHHLLEMMQYKLE